MCLKNMKFKKGMTPWNKGLTKKTDTRLDYERPTTFKKGEHRSIETEFKSEEMKIKQLAENNTSWKGDKAGRNTKHRWIEYRKGKAKEHKCEHCGKQAHDWSNRDHKYSRELEDYQALCVSCHLKFDYKYNNRGKKKV